MKKRTGNNYGRKYAAITLAAVTAACTGAAAGSAVTVAAAEENKTLVYDFHKDEKALDISNYIANMIGFAMNRVKSLQENGGIL